MIDNCFLNYGVKVWRSYAWQLGEVPQCTQPNVKHKSRCGILPNCLLAVVLLGITILIKNK